MPITFGEARQRLAQWTGKGGKCDSPEVASFVREVMQYLLISGEYGGQRKFTFSAVKGVITVPYELEVPQKIKIGNSIGSVWDKWFEWYGYGELGDNCLSSDALLEDPNYYPIVYDIPSGGAHVGTLALNEESCDANIIVKGVDLSGRQVVTFHEGKQIVGEYLSIVRGQIATSQVKFGRIDEIIKTPTSGYVQLLWVYPETGERGFLADYSPMEEKPRYRRFKLKTRCAEIVEVSILGKIRLKEFYADNDLIPFDTLYTLSLAAQAIHADYNADADTAQKKDNRMQQMITRENTFKKPNVGQPIEVFGPMSGGSIKNIVGQFPYRKPFWRFR